MNKEALKSIYAYNMLFNTSSGTNDADGDVKFNTDLISDFDLQNFDAKRFEYYTTLLKTFDNDRETLMNVLNKYNSVKSLRVKERKIIREINDYINKIRRVNGKFVGGAGVETLSEKITELKINFTKFLEKAKVIIKEKEQSTASLDNITTMMKREDIDQKEKKTKLQRLVVMFIQSKKPAFLEDFEITYRAFNRKNNILELNKDDIDEFETDINTFEQHINSYEYKKTTGGEISSENTEKFLEIMDKKNSDDSTIEEPLLQEFNELIDLARTIITLARKSVKLARKKLLDPNKEADAAGNLKTKVIANSSGLKDLLLKINKKLAKEVSDNINLSVKEVDYLSKDVGVIKDKAHIISVNANIMKEEARLELLKVQEALASLPEKTRDMADISVQTIRRNIQKKITNYKIMLTKSKEAESKSKEAYSKSKEAHSKSEEALKKYELVAVEAAVKVAKYVEGRKDIETKKSEDEQAKQANLANVRNVVVENAVNKVNNIVVYIEDAIEKAKSDDVRNAVIATNSVVTNILPQPPPPPPQRLQLLQPIELNDDQQEQQEESPLPQEEEPPLPQEELHISEEEKEVEYEAWRKLNSIIDTAKNYKKELPEHNIRGIIKIQEALTTAIDAFAKANSLAEDAFSAYKTVEDILTKFKTIERDIKEKAKKANEFSINTTLLSAELAEKTKKEADKLIIKANELVEKAKAQRNYASHRVEYIQIYKDRLDKQVDIVSKNKDNAQEQASNIDDYRTKKRQESIEEKSKTQTPRLPIKTPRVQQLKLSTGGAKTEEKYSDDTLKAKYLEKQSYRNISPVIQQGLRDVTDLNKGKLVRIKTDNKIDQLANDIDIYNALSVEEREDNRVNITNKIKDFENDPQNPLEELEITLDDRIVFIIATFFIRYITILMVQWCVDIDIIKSFYEGFIYYAIIYVILFWFVVLFINIDNGYDVKYMNFNGIINSIRSLFYYFYMGTNGISRLLIHTSLILLLIVIPIILNIKKKPEFKDEANEETVVNTKILNYEERKQLSKTLTLFTMFIWLFTSIIATKF
jgi:hypothetical protein